MSREKHNFRFNQIYVLLLIIVAFGFSVFSSSTSTPFNQKESTSFKTPVITGVSDTTTLCLSPEYMLNAWYNAERLDSISDTLDLSKPGVEKMGLYYQFDRPTELTKMKLSNKHLQLIVDTVNELTLTKKPIWASFLFHRVFDSETEILQDDTLIQLVKSFPIYVVNMSTDQTAEIELQDGSLIMVVEAKDKKGNWKSIEYWSSSWCGNSYYTQLIPPKHMLMTRGIKCSGDYRTKCRRKVSNGKESIYSNAFYMSINEAQFEKPIQKD